MIALAGLLFALMTKRYTQLVLIGLIASLVLATILNIISVQIAKSNFAIVVTTWLSVTADDFAHCLVSYAYVKIMIEMHYLLDKDILVNNDEKLEQRAGQVRNLHKGLIIAASLCFINGLTISLSLLTNSRVLLVLNIYSRQILQTIFLLLWGFATLQFYHRLNDCGGLQPDKLLFKLHAWIITSNVLVIIIIVVLFMISTLVTGSGRFSLQGIVAILVVLCDLIECLGFGLVFYIMCPFNAIQKKRQTDFQSFLMNGITSFDELVRTIMDENPDMNDDEREYTRFDLARFNDLIRGTETTRTMIANFSILIDESSFIKDFSNIRIGQTAYDIRATYGGQLKHDDDIADIPEDE